MKVATGFRTCQIRAFMPGGEDRYSRRAATADIARTGEVVSDTGQARLRGRSIIADWGGAGSGRSFRAVDPASGLDLEPEFASASEADVDAAARGARSAFDAFRETEPEERAAFLEAIAANLDARRAEIVARACLESGLPQARLDSEHLRTANQLRLFGREVRAGSHQGVRIDEAQPDRRPLPAPDVRQRRIGVGPVAVFGPSNFPLAFSAAGGDVASALAAGCPVIVKAHSAHPGTAELAGSAVADAAEACGLPGGVFSLLFGPGRVVGQALAARPEIKAIAFTGSQEAGTALMSAAAARTEPIPVFAEMSSVNPVVVLAGAAAGDLVGLAAGYASSLTLGAGQFCTNPSMLLAPAPAGELVAAVGAALSQEKGQVMLTADIRGAYREGLARLEEAGAARVAVGRAGTSANAPAPVLFTAAAAQVRRSPDLQEEVFGSAGLVAAYESLDELKALLEELPGQLTASIHMAESDHAAAAELVPVLERKAGRLIVNGWPTGVEVGCAMVHGGPFPAASDPRSTSVGALAIQRFQRPVCYQGFPQRLLPPAARDGNPLSLPRLVNGKPQP